MPTATEFLDTIALAATRCRRTKVMLSPDPDDRPGLKLFKSLAEWRRLVLEFRYQTQTRSP
jgi:hypothetical protein